ncbi:hypothetical protein HMPREF1556_00767 [Porphyromonas sp. oral taxon 278 str. W7784]|nr:hypothetical protein HMPREF1556_00767 [Porphyromonas sp. oral taxon 278 str. W7784]
MTAYPTRRMRRVGVRDAAGATWRARVVWRDQGSEDRSHH